MTRPDRTPRLAVLIDADNASPRIAVGLFEEIAKIGEASVRRIYGDFSSSRSQGWADVLSRFAIIPQQQFAYVTGKNASDITLVIDAMDLLHSGRLDGFCLVSSDSDFTRLAARIREQGIDVFGFGEKKTPESFRQACRRFIYTENLLPERAANGSPQTTPRPLEGPETAADLLRRVVDQMDTEDGWVSLGAFGKQIANVSSDFDPRTYGFKKLSDLIRSTGTFTVDDADPGRIRVRLKAAAQPVRRPSPAPEPAAPRGEAPATPVGGEAAVSGAEVAAVSVAATVPVTARPARRAAPSAPARAAATAPSDEAAAPSGALAAAKVQAVPGDAAAVSRDTSSSPAEAVTAGGTSKPVRGRAPRPATPVQEPSAAPRALLSPAALAAHVAAHSGADDDDPPPPRQRTTRSRSAG